jgi:hypothetical protein
MWKINWHESPRHMQESLGFVSLAFRLRRAIDEMDVATIREVLRSAAELDILEHPLFMQTLELLERLSL